MRKIIGAMLFFCVLIVIPKATSAHSLITPRYEHILLVGGSIDIVNGKAELAGQVAAQANKATSVEVIVTLQKLNSYNGWDDIESWSVSQQGLNAGCLGSYYVQAGACFRAHITGTAYIGEKAVETVSAATTPKYS